MTYIPGENFFSPGASADQTEIDIDAEDARLRDDPMRGRTDSYGWTNFSTFLDRGGKILFYHGVNDAWFSAFDTLGFYRRAGEANEGWSDANRYYHVPGMGHCAGGANTYDSFDLLSAVVPPHSSAWSPAIMNAWIRKNIACPPPPAVTRYYWSPGLRRIGRSGARGIFRG